MIIFRCPKCDNPMELDLQHDGDFLCTGGPSPCGHTWEPKKPSDPLELIEGEELDRLVAKAKEVGQQPQNTFGDDWQAPCRHRMCLSYYAGEGAPLREWLDETKKKRYQRKIACGLDALEEQAKNRRLAELEERAKNRKI